MLLLWVSEVGTSIPECRVDKRRARDSVPVIPFARSGPVCHLPVSSVYLLKKEASEL